MKLRFSAVVQILTTLCLAVLTQGHAITHHDRAQDNQPARKNLRRPSTAEERARAVQYSRRLQAEPFAKELSDEDAWLMQWLDQVSDVSATTCSINLSDLVNARDPINGTAELFGYSGFLLRAMTASRVSFVIEHPDKASDLAAVYLAGIQGTLETYQSVRKQYDTFHVTRVDQWLKMREQGKLVRFARSRAKKECKP